MAAAKNVLVIAGCTNPLGQRLVERLRTQCHNVILHVERPVPHFEFRLPGALAVHESHYNTRLLSSWASIGKKFSAIIDLSLLKNCRIPPLSPSTLFISVRSTGSPEPSSHVLFKKSVLIDVPNLVISDEAVPDPVIISEGGVRAVHESDILRFITDYAMRDRIVQDYHEPVINVNISCPDTGSLGDLREPIGVLYKIDPRSPLTRTLLSSRGQKLFNFTPHKFTELI